MKIILFILLLLNISFANGIKSVEILKDDGKINFENVKTNQNFKRVHLPLVRKTTDEYWVKIIIDKKSLSQEKQYILKVNSQLDYNDFVYDKELKRDFIDPNIIALDIKELKAIYIKINNSPGLISMDLEVQEKKLFLEIFFLKILLYGIAYGVIFSAFLYYLAFYIFNREKSFIYYSLTQFSMLLMIIIDSGIEDFAIFSFLLFSNLFTKEFLNTKKYTPKLDKLLTFIMVFYIVDFIFNEPFSDILPTSILLLFYIFTAIIVYNKTKHKPIIFYIIGWSIVICTFIFIDFQFDFYEFFKHSIDLGVFIHIVAPMESLILAFALSYKVKLIEEKRIENERMLIHQNKLAAMGEMISNIAHQWRQPLTHLSYIFMNINSAFKHQKLDQNYIDDKTQEATSQLEYMSNTIDDFKNFYSPTKEKTSFSIKKAISSSYTIISSVLEDNKIMFEIEGEDYIIKGYESEFSQVILNLLTNAKDVLVLKSIQKPKVNIKIEKNKIIICDNAGGIDKKIKEKIFEPYFTTKTKGSGIGLYMSKVIIETHFNGKLYHQNKDYGSCFILELNL